MGSKPQPGTYSASQVSTLIGLNQYATPLHGFQVMKEAIEPGWNAKHGYTLPPEPDNPAIRWGLGFENSIIKLAEEREGCEIVEREELYFANKEGKQTFKVYGDEFFSCHIDGRFTSGYHAHPVIHEGKTTNHWAYSSTKKEIQDAIDLTTGQVMPGFSIVRKWGKPGTDQVPQEYQIQAAVQRICTGAELVKLSVLVFPKAQAEYEELGWRVTERKKEGFTIFEKKSPIGDEEEIYKDDEINLYRQKQGVEWFNTMYWAHALAQMGNFHEYLLPSAPILEAKIIESIQRFDTENMQPGIPPDSTTFADVKRIMPHQLGTVIATKELTKKCIEYSENVKQLGSTSPLHARQKLLKPEIMNLANALRRSDPTNPPDEFLILNPDGGDMLANVKADKNGVISFRAARAK